MTTKISVDNIQANTLSVLGGAGPRITSVVVTDSSYQATGESIVDTSGGYIIINGTGFVVNCNVIVGTTRATNTVFANSTTVRAQIPAVSTGKYTLYVENPDGSTAFRPISVGFDTVQWVTPANNATVSSVINSNVSVSLLANSASNTTITYAANTLPTGLTLTGNTISGNVTSYGSSATLLTATSGLGRIARNILNFAVVSAPGQQAYTTAGTYSWTAPAGVFSVSVVCVGGGGAGGGNAGYPGGGGGGGLGWKNNIAVTPGQSYTVVVGAGGAAVAQSSGVAGGNSYFMNTSTVVGFGGGGGSPQTGGLGGSYVGDGGGNGGNGGGGTYGQQNSGGGGGAAGYTGNGGKGADAAFPDAPGVGSGGGASGGRTWSVFSGSGGGVGILGQGASGGSTPNNGYPAPGGSGGQDGSLVSNSTAGSGGAYGGGGGGAHNTTASTGGVGAVRIIWGLNRAFPAANTGNL